MHPSILGTALEPEEVKRFLERIGYSDVQITRFEPIGSSSDAEMKSGGYGKPVRIRFQSGSKEHDTVLRTSVADDFGHDRRSDRYGASILGFDSFSQVPKHCRPLAVGTVSADGSLHAIELGEPFLLTSFDPGEIYIKDILRLASESEAKALDLERASTLANYLADLHATPDNERSYRRFLRDTLGSGEGVFGLTDAYPEKDPVAPPERLMALEKRWVEWRWSLKSQVARCRRTHGDFHPFNILFTDGTEMSVLDASRGVAGDPADDLTALSINYLFFSLYENGAFQGALRQLWDRFFDAYVRRVDDSEDLFKVMGPFFAWRCLVLACPAWYPDVKEPVRETMLRFAERLLEGEPFRPDQVQELLK